MQRHDVGDEVFPVRRLVAEVARLVGRQRLGALSQREEATLRAAANAPDNGLALVRLVESGPLDVALPGAVALAWVESPFVRRRVETTRTASAGLRRMLFAGALGAESCGDEWLPPLVLIDNDPALFVARLCEGRDFLDAPTLERVEQWRAQLDADPAPLATALLGRRLTPAARESLLGQLGRTPGVAVSAVLEAEERRSSGDAGRLARRERMRQRLLDVVDRPAGQAFLAAPDDDLLVRAFLDRPIQDGLVRRTVLEVTRDGLLASWVSIADSATPGGSAVTTATLRRLVEAITPTASRGDIDVRFHGAGVGDGTQSMAQGPAWNPLEGLVAWPEGLLSNGAQVLAPAWPPHIEEIDEVWRDARALLLRDPRATSAALARLRVLECRLSVAGDARANAVGAEVMALAMRRAGPLFEEFGRRATTETLWKTAALPSSWRAGLREQLRLAIGTTDPAWDDVRRLDLAQQLLEDGARDIARMEGTLPEPSTLDLVPALDLATRRLDSLAYWADQRARPYGVAVWAEHCLKRCPHRCFAPVEGASLPVWNGALPEGRERKR